MKKIFVFSSVHNWDDTRIYKKQCVSLAKRYHVILNAPAKKSIRFSDNFELISLAQWEKVSDRKNNRKELFRRIKDSDADVFHFHDPELIFIGLYIKFIKQKKVVYDIHENVAKQILDKEYIPSKFIRKIVSTVYWLLEQLVIRFMDGVVVAGEDIVSQYKSKVVINNYPIVRTSNLEKKDNCVVYIGKMNVIYGIYQIAEAVKILNEEFGKKIYLKLIGEFDDKKLEDEILSKYEKYIKFMGRKKQETVYEEVSKSLIGIVNYLPVPNHYNLRSNKLFEYMECSIPVIYPNFVDWIEKLSKYNIGIPVDPMNHYKIAEAIQYLLENQDKASLMGSNGREAIENLFNWAAEEKKLNALYESLLQ